MIAVFWDFPLHQKYFFSFQIRFVLLKQEQILKNLSSMAKNTFKLKLSVYNLALR